MEIKGKVHCFFEQSGTFKNEFIKLGIPAEDYDIQNNFGETDHQMDLFAEIEKAYELEESIIDYFRPDDLIIAFFPCIYFSQQNTTFFDGTNLNYRNKGTKYVADEILKRSRYRQHFYEVALKMFTVCDIRGIKLIVENPYYGLHYLHANFPYKPKIIDSNRQLRGGLLQEAYAILVCELRTDMRTVLSESAREEDSQRIVRTQRQYVRRGAKPHLSRLRKELHLRLHHRQGSDKDIRAFAIRHLLKLKIL